MKQLIVMYVKTQPPWPRAKALPRSLLWGAAARAPLSPTPLPTEGPRSPLLLEEKEVLRKETEGPGGCLDPRQQENIMGCARPVRSEGSSPRNPLGSPTSRNQALGESRGGLWSSSCAPNLGSPGGV